MAMTATVSLNPATALINQSITATYTVSNDGATAVNVTSIAPLAYVTGGTVGEPIGVNYGSPNLGAGALISVAASGSTVFPVNLVFFAPSTGILGQAGPASGRTYSVGAVIQSSDGSVFSPTAVTGLINPLPLPASQL